MKKLLGILLLSSVCFMNVKAQQKNRDEEAKFSIFNIIELKHDYEKANLELRDPRRGGDQGKVDKCKVAYIGAIKAMQKKSVKKIYLSYIDNAIKNDAESLTKKGDFYIYVDPTSSVLDRNNIITYLEYLKIIQYCVFEQNKDTLLPLKEIPLIRQKQI